MARLGIWYLVCCYSEVYQVKIRFISWLTDLINHLNQLMTMNDLLETMQIFFFSRDQKDTINVHEWMDVYSRVWAQ